MAKDSGLVKITNGALDDSALNGGTIVLRGVIVPDTMSLLRTDDYQREQQHVTPRSSLWRAMSAKAILPDIELAMRSEKFDSKGDLFTLKDDVFIVDGLQRITTALLYLQKFGPTDIRQGCLLHFNTTKEWERERFKVLNANRSKVSPSVLLRNEREISPAVKMLYNLCTTDKSFVLHNRVQWSQKMARSELVSSLNLLKGVTMLHHHKHSALRTSLSNLIPLFDKQVDLVGSQIFRENIKTFWEVVDECWGVRLAQYSGAPHLRATFMRALTRMFSDHHDFWVASSAERRFFVSQDMRKKLSSLNSSDPTVAGLAGAGGKAPAMLYMMFVDHINSGKRTKRLSSRNPGGTLLLEEPSETEE